MARANPPQRHWVHTGVNRPRTGSLQAPGRGSDLITQQDLQWTAGQGRLPAGVASGEASRGDVQSLLC